MMGNQRTRISDLLSRALEDLSEDNFERFKDKLLHSDFKGKGNISQSRLEDATRIATKNLLLGFYGEDASVDVTIEVLIWINCRDVAAKLREEREKGKKPQVTVAPVNLSPGIYPKADGSSMEL